MRYISGFIIVCLILGFRLNAQSIKADITSGCNPLLVNYSLDPPVAVGTTVTWDFGNGTTSSGNTSPSVTYDEPGIYSVSCLINNTTTINALNFITVHRTPSSAFEYHDSLLISSHYYVFRHIRSSEDTGTLDLLWQFPEGIFQTTPTAVYDFSAPGSYQVSLIATSSAGCADTTIRTVTVANLLEAPNVFTPNDDAINDFFQIRTNGIDTYLFSVYTRSGILIYRSESPVILWDGRSFSGQIMTQGIYYYMVEKKTGDTSKNLKGMIYLLR